MAEGLAPNEVAKEISEHTHHVMTRDEELRDRLITILEAVLLAVVAFLAAYSGYASAKWSTDSRLALSRATAARTNASRANLNALAQRNFDSSTFDAWFTAYVAGNQKAMDIAAKRFSPGFRVAFDAWQATDPENNPNATPGPTYMPQYKLADAEKASELDKQADELYIEGSKDGTNADDYVRVTVYLAMVLFLVAISGHFRLRGARYGLVTVGIIIMVIAVTTMAGLPRPPG